MNKTTVISMFTLLIFGLSACGNNENNENIESNSNNQNEENNEAVEEEEEEEEEEEITFRDLMADDFVLEFDTGLELESVISDEDYEKYNSIMDELSSDWDRTEEEIYTDIADDYDSTPEELDQFMRDNSQAAIDRDFLGGTLIQEEDLNNFVHDFMITNFDAEVEISNVESDITSYRAISSFDFRLISENYDEEHEGILNYDYNVSENYGSAKAFQFKVDEENIDRVSD